MGSAKNAMIERDENLAAAAAFLHELDILDYCEYHGNYSDAGVGLEGIWPKVMAERKKGESGSVPWAASLGARDFTDLLTAAYNDNCAEECYACAKNRDE